jgi:hypothetical protein
VNDRAHTQRRGTADLPKDVVRIRAVGQEDLGAHLERRPDLENEDPVRVALGIEMQVS